MVSIHIDWTEEDEKEDFNLECPNTNHHERFGTDGETEEGATTDLNGDPCEPYEQCKACEYDSGYVRPIVNHGHIIDYDGMITDEIRLKIALETACVLVQNNKTDDWFIALTGCGMDLGPDVAYSYVLAQKWLPLDLMEKLDVGWCKTQLSKEQFEKLSTIMKEQSARHAERFADMSRKWTEV